MNTPSSYRTSFVLLGGVFLVLGIAGFVFFRSYTLSIQPKIPSEQACPSDAQICPDGTVVGRMGPSCEFAPCPAESTPIPPMDEGFGAGGGDGGLTVSSVPALPGESPMAQIPELPLDSVYNPSVPITLKYLVEHRSALNEKRIAVTGVVIMNRLNEEECAPGSACALIYRPPQLVLADSTASTRDMLYDVTIIFPEEARAEADQYAVGKTVTVTASVESSIDRILLTQ